MTTIINGSSPSITFSDATTQTTAANVYLASGTALLFQQTAAPTGWTKVTTYNDYALRITSGSVTTGGSVAFSTAFSASNTVDGTTLTTNQIPAHGHAFSGQTGGVSANHTHSTYDWGNNAGGYFISNSPSVFYYNSASNFTSGTMSSDHSHGYSGTTSNNSTTGSSHNHTLTNLAVQYVDAIICTKN